MITQMNTMLSSEVWQDIQGYSGIYQVSTLGRIRSLKKGKIKLLKPYINIWVMLFYLYMLTTNKKHIMFIISC